MCSKGCCRVNRNKAIVIVVVEVIVSRKGR